MKIAKNDSELKEMKKEEENVLLSDLNKITRACTTRI